MHVTDASLAHRSAFDLNEANQPPWRLIPSREVSRLTGLSIQTLANFRLRGTGPAYVGAVRGKGNKVFYRLADVEAWLALRRGEPKEPWEITRDWLAERGVTLENPSADGVAWLAERVARAI